MPAYRNSVVSSRQSSYDGKINHGFTCCNPLIYFHLIRLDQKAFKPRTLGRQHRPGVQVDENRYKAAIRP